MTNVLTLDGKEYVPATDAGIHFGYTKDYILMLIKQNKIDGKKVGNKWYAHLPSGEVFFKNARTEREARQKQISIERKAELKNYSQVRVSNHSNTAILETLVIVVIGLSLGASGYIGTTTNMSATHVGGVSFFQNIAISFYQFFNPVETTLVQSAKATEQYAVENSVSVGTTTYTSLVVAPDEVFTEAKVESIQDSFSDEVAVSIDPENPQTGIITPIFKDTKSESYRFLMVPVTEGPQ